MVLGQHQSWFEAFVGFCLMKHFKLNREDRRILTVYILNKSNGPSLLLSVGKLISFLDL